MADKYDFTPEVRDQILAAIKAKGTDQIVCSVCKHWTWTITEGFIGFRILRNFWLNQQSGGGSLVSVALVCDTCGNTLLMNLGALGLDHLVAPSAEELRERFGFK